jgi:hypothetical protein
MKMALGNRLSMMAILIVVSNSSSATAKPAIIAVNYNPVKVERTKSSKNDRIEIGGQIVNLPNYRNPSSCEDIAINYRDRPAPDLQPLSNSIDLKSGKIINNRCRYLLQIPRKYAGKTIEISITPVLNQAGSYKRFASFKVPETAPFDRSLNGPNFEF